MAAPPMTETSIAGRQVADLACRVGIVGGLAIGLSGLLAELAGRLLGMGWVVGDAMGITYTTERCAQYLALRPDAGSCEQAAILDHFDEVVSSRVAVGVLALLLAGGWLVWRRRPSYRRAPDFLVGAIGLALAGMCAAVLGLVSLNSLAFGMTAGIGAPLTAAACAALAVLVFLPAVVAGLRTGRLPGTDA